MKTIKTPYDNFYLEGKRKHEQETGEQFPEKLATLYKELGKLLQKAYLQGYEAAAEEQKQ